MGCLKSRRQDDSESLEDPVIHLTKRDKKMILETRRLFDLDAKAAGVELFVQVFAMHPDLQQRFSFAHGVPDSVLPKLKRMQLHALRFWPTLSSIVLQINDAPFCLDCVQSLGFVHAKHDIQVNDMEKMADGMVHYLNTRSELNDDYVEAWRKFFSVFIHYFDKGFRRGMEKSE